MRDSSDHCSTGLSYLGGVPILLGTQESIAPEEELRTTLCASNCDGSAIAHDANQTMAVPRIRASPRLCLVSWSWLLGSTQARVSVGSDEHGGPSRDERCAQQPEEPTDHESRRKAEGLREQPNQDRSGHVAKFLERPWAPIVAPSRPVRASRLTKVSVLVQTVPTPMPAHSTSVLTLRERRGSSSTAAQQDLAFNAKHLPRLQHRVWYTFGRRHRVGK